MVLRASSVEEMIYIEHRNFVMKSRYEPNLVIMPSEQYDELRRASISKSREDGEILQYLKMCVVVSERIREIEVLYVQWVNTHCKNY